MKRYLIRLSKEYLEQAPAGERGINRFSLLANPAINKKGYFFETAYKYMDVDSMKMRIAAPAVMAGEIFRSADKDEGEHTVVFDRESLDQIFDALMSEFNAQDKINIDHSDTLLNAYIREIWQIEDPENDRAKTEFGMLLPAGTIFVIIQFRDKDEFDEVVRTGRTGISVEAVFDRVEVKLQKHENQNKMKKKRYSFNAVAVDENGKTDNGETLVVIAEKEKLEEGDEVVIVNEELEADEAYTGDVVIDGKEVVVTNGKIEQLPEVSEESTEEVELSEEVKEEDNTEKVELQEEVITSEAVEVEEVKPTMTEEQINSIIDARLQEKMDEVYKRIGEIEASMVKPEKTERDYEFRDEKINFFAVAKKK